MYPSFPFMASSTSFTTPEGSFTRYREVRDPTSHICAPFAVIAYLIFPICKSSLGIDPRYLPVHGTTRQPASFRSPIRRMAASPMWLALSIRVPSRSTAASLISCVISILSHTFHRQQRKQGIFLPSITETASPSRCAPIFS